jgi:hypothetical protein
LIMAAPSSSISTMQTGSACSVSGGRYLLGAVDEAQEDRTDLWYLHLLYGIRRWSEAVGEWTTVNQHLGLPGAYRE